MYLSFAQKDGEYLYSSSFCANSLLRAVEIKRNFRDCFFSYRLTFWFKELIIRHITIDKSIILQYIWILL